MAAGSRVASCRSWLKSLFRATRGDDQYQKLKDAIALLVFNTEQYPDSWNVYDSLGEAYVDSERYDLAVYRRSLALNQKNAGAFETLQKAAAVSYGPN